MYDSGVMELEVLKRWRFTEKRSFARRRLRRRTLRLKRPE
jgi:hypothetical protein